MTRFYNAQTPDGVPVDGVNDEAVGNLDDPCNPNYDTNGTGAFDQNYRTLYRMLQLCDATEYHQSVDLPDVTFAGANSSLGWSQTAGPWGTIVDRYEIDRVSDLTPGGAAQSLVAAPYYRDDSCFDDGTGTDPGPKLHLRSGDEPRTTAKGAPRRCWAPQGRDPEGRRPLLPGQHRHARPPPAVPGGLRQRAPDGAGGRDRRRAADGDVPGQQPNVGEQYGRGFEKPLVAAAG